MLFGHCVVRDQSKLSPDGAAGSHEEEMMDEGGRDLSNVIFNHIHIFQFGEFEPKSSPVSFKISSSVPQLVRRLVSPG